jgi:diguanylate cyclase (GGDEF)-like protein
LSNLSFAGVADRFLHPSEKGGTSPYLLRKRVFVYANIIQFAVTVLALIVVPFAVAVSYPADRLVLLGFNMMLSASFIASARLEISFERAAFFYITSFIINVTVAVCTSGGGVSYMLCWYVVIAVAIGFFLHEWKRDAALLMLEITLLVLVGLVLNDFQFADNTADQYRPFLGIGSLFFAVMFCALLGIVNSSMSDTHERALADQAFSDPLTGLLNRRGFLQHVKKQKGGSLLMLDIDHFKAINDDYGHDVGDRILVNLAEKIQETVRDDDRVVRLGGEEFAIWFNLAEPSKLAGVVDRIRAAISEPVEIEDNQQRVHSITVRVSGGLVAREMDEDIALVLAEADQLLYKAKETGRDQVLTA